MQIEIVKIITGVYASFYTVRIEGEKHTLFEKFILENQSKYHHELKNIRNRILSMSSATGARKQFFKINEGKPGDGVCALYDNPERHLRLYCIRYGTVAVILGGGGQKPQEMQALQESEKLTEENYLLRDISAAITRALISREVDWSEDGMELLGDTDPIIIEI